MLVLLPDRKDGLAEIEETLTAGLIQSCVEQMDVEKVDLFLPRFEVTWGTVDLRAALAALGMPLAFEYQQADFSGINGRRPPDFEALFIASIFHRAFVEVKEEGTEAAAATAVVLAPTASPSPSQPRTAPVFRADHPFLYLIRDRRSGVILLLGRMADPSSS